MQENTTKIIGVCVADISTDYNDRFFEAFKRLMSFTSKSSFSVHSARYIGIRNMTSVRETFTN